MTFSEREPFETWCERRRALVEHFLDQILPAAEAEPRCLHEAMRYAVLGGGQLGWMLGLAGIPLGVRCRFLDPVAGAPASAAPAAQSPARSATMSAAAALSSTASR